MPYVHQTKNLRDLLIAWSEECAVERFQGYRTKLEVCRELSKKLVDKTERDDECEAQARIAAYEANDFFTRKDESKAVEHYMNSEAPGTWRLINVIRWESYYEFVWWKPE